MTSNGHGRLDTEALREEIRRTRVELGETMEALAAKADVKARLKESAGQARQRMREQAASTVARLRGQAVEMTGLARADMAQQGEMMRRNPTPWAAVAVGAVAVVVAVVVIQGRRR
ncbi:DUF3618 domain-containing protein [Micromonospora avicenniae]|uniref:DUF3618 domain-containing protein n=1 Tax=Micromonospora avicenniae TaxID=1198245 RepID=UPI0033263EC4